jgi:ParB-like chromosome segregation protein Spo0J
VTLVNTDGEVVEVALTDLRYGPPVRAERLDLNHVERLALVLDACPPIVVQADTGKVLDGFHRWNAATRLNRSTIRAVVVDCVDAEALELAVKTNLAHGLPLTIAERKGVARSLVETTDWSDSRIASACGLTDKTVAELRPRPTSETPRLDTRSGRDGKRRPVDPAAVRDEIAALIDEKPNLSDREVALRTKSSPSTVGDVRKRKNEGEPVLPPKLQAVPPASTEVRVGDVVTFFPVKGRWSKDPSITTNDKGDPEEVVAGCPAALTEGAVAAAECTAAFWTRIAEALGRRGLSAVEAK